MRKLIFLDTWVLSQVNNPTFSSRLRRYLTSRGYTIALTSLLLTELYDMRSLSGQQSTRTGAVAEFFGQQECVIIDPQDVYRAEIRAYPAKLQAPPMETLDGMPSQNRTPAMRMFFQRDAIFRQEGKDVAEWFDGYRTIKDSWLQDAGTIIDDACANGVLTRDDGGCFIELESSKEEFLCYLDRRFFAFLSQPELKQLGERLIRLYQGDTSTLPACRLHSLCFWYMYVDIEQANRLAFRPSDVGDLYHISLMPYLQAITLDKTMYRLVARLHDYPPTVHCDCIDSKKLTGYLS